MINTQLAKAAPNPSGFGMPITGATCGTGIGMATAAGTGFGTVEPTYAHIVRDRHVAGVSLAQGAVPGPTTWSPPIS